MVASRSAIGEQYVDLQPTSASGGPYLENGSTIRESRLPEPLEDVVKSAVDFTSSIPVDDLHTVITELGNAFNGQGGRTSPGSSIPSASSRGPASTT